MNTLLQSERRSNQNESGKTEISQLIGSFPATVSNRPESFSKAWIAIQLLSLRAFARSTKKSFLRAIFNKSEKIYGRFFDSEIVGRAHFSMPVGEVYPPIENIEVNLLGRTRWGAVRRLGGGFSRKDGSFSVAFDLVYARSWRMKLLWLEFYEPGPVQYTGDTVHRTRICRKRVVILKEDVIGLGYSVGEIRIKYWEYRVNSPIARVAEWKSKRHAPERFTSARTKVLTAQLVTAEFTKRKHLQIIRTKPGTLTLDQIQADYPENLTSRIEKQFPGKTRTDEWFGERMMNGVFAADFDKDPTDYDAYWIHHHWNSYDKTQNYAMPDVDIRFSLNKAGIPIPQAITLTGPLNVSELNQTTRRTFTPDDGANWLAAKRIARVSASLRSELVHHFAGTHLNTEQYSVAAHRHLRFNPIGLLLYPHLKEVTLINHVADRILINDGYISQASALTPKGIDQVVRQTMGTLDWKGWLPVKPISEVHTYAKAANLYWEILQDFAVDFIQENIDGIKTYWHEIFSFSETLVTHSADFFLCKYLQKELLYSNQVVKPDAYWYQQSNRMDLTLKCPYPHDTAIPKALSSITQAQEGYQVTDTDWQNLHQACCYIIFQATFGHYWANAWQYDDIGEFRFNGLGLRFGDGPDGILAPESDDGIAPDPAVATGMMWFGTMLSHTGYGYITKNEEGDIHPKLIKALENNRDAFSALGVSIDKIPSRTNI